MDQSNTNQHFWLNGQFVSTETYLERVRAARERTERLKLTKTWIARKVSRSRPHVSSVLNGRDRGPNTLLLIEQLIDQVEAGEVSPR